MKPDEQTIAKISYKGDGIGNCHCSKCNASINKNDVYCRICGRKITGYQYLNVRRPSDVQLD